ncbi:IclR family transcriptional regulator [Terriglobus sp. 2YAB30_2]|uniref:IclR family transcriptional regulator n=3 Tax=unclassified Terriglobus TaxID=2628988 RepID=UPI003F9A371C
MSGANRTPSVPSVERALHLLEILAHSKNGLTLSQMVEMSGHPKSSLHCLLLTLERLGYLTRSPQTGRYLFGLKLFGLANASLAGLQVREQAAPFLVQLMTQTKFTVHMGVLEQHEAVLVAKYNPPGGESLATWRGKRMELHCTGVGKALGAYLSEEELETLFKFRKFPRHNENTITSLRKLKDEFASIRQKMCAIDDEEEELGWRCIGAPIFDETGSAVAAVSISGSVHRINTQNINRLETQIKACALNISYALGYLKEQDAYKRA